MQDDALIYIAGRGEFFRNLGTLFQVSNFNVVYFSRGEDLFEAVRAVEPEGIILDIDIPGTSGLILAKRVRELHGGPLLLLGSSGNVSFQAAVYQLGADGYALKSDTAIVILHRFRAIINRYHACAGEEQDVLLFSEGRLKIDVNNYRATVDGREISFTLKEWNLLRYMAQNAQEALPRQQMLDQGLDYTFGGYDRLIDTYIKNIRLKIGSPECIETIRGYGYRFTGEITEERSGCIQEVH